MNHESVKVFKWRERGHDMPKVVERLLEVIWSSD
jgi:hypothetical protein